MAHFTSIAAQFKGVPGLGTFAVFPNTQEVIGDLLDGRHNSRALRAIKAIVIRIKVKMADFYMERFGKGEAEIKLALEAMDKLAIILEALNPIVQQVEALVKFANPVPTVPDPTVRGS